MAEMNTVSVTVSDLECTVVWIITPLMRKKKEVENK
jgi:hypothetical protein